ncbi:hypothetical protein U1Q18_007914 [Sarracenia purpurea var. burkii]
MFLVIIKYAFGLYMRGGGKSDDRQGSIEEVLAVQAEFGGREETQVSGRLTEPVQCRGGEDRCRLTNCTTRRTGRCRRR